MRNSFIKRIKINSVYDFDAKAIKIKKQKERQSRSRSITRYASRSQATSPS
jgi:hypothetical protein